MKTVRDYIKEAKVIGYDVAVEDNEGYWEHDLMGDGWWAYGEWGWHTEEHGFDERTVKKIDMMDEEKIMIIVVED